ncbi:MAG: phage tail family protein [Bacteroidales bacterium]|nr:phage tail family protein [Bacteroidales bacterium]
MATPITITIGTDGSVSPFGGQLLRDGTDIPPLPEYEEYAEEVPGYAGRYLFGQDPRTREINLAVNIVKAEAQKASFLRQLAAWINPANGEMYLINNNDPDKRLKVICAEPPSYKDYFGRLKLNIPLVGRPYYESVALNTISASGTAINKGNVSCPCTIVFGPGTNPSVSIGGVTVSYTGTIAAGCTVTINTEKRTAIYTTGAGVVTNALADVNGEFPWLAPNLLTPNQSEVETDTTGLTTAGLPGTLVRDTANYNLGAASAKVTATAGSDITLRSSIGTLGILVTVGASYTFTGYTKTTVAAGRQMHPLISWYDSAGSLVTVSSGTNVSCPDAWTKMTITATAPATSVYAASGFKVLSALNGEILWYDTASFTRGSNAVVISDTVTITWRDWWI